jgi:hypothetical protein
MAAVTPQVFDSSGLKDIASAMPDVVGSTANAYKLKDMVDTSQMNTLKLAEAQKEIQTRQQTNEALKNLPLNATQEQRMAALEKIRQGPGGYEAAMQVMRNFGAVDKEAADAAEVKARTMEHLSKASAQEFEAYQAKVAAFDGNFLPVWQKFNDLVGKGMSVAQAKAAVQTDYQKAYVGAASATDAAGNLIYNDPGSKKKFDQIGTIFDPDKLGPEIMASENIRKQLEEAKKNREESKFKGAETKLAEARTENVKAGGESNVLGATKGTQEYAVREQIIGELAGRGIAFPRGKGVLGPYITGLIQANPGLTPAQIADKVATGGAERAGTAATIKAFDIGQQGNSVRSFNVGLSHLDTLDELATALQNKDLKVINRIGNAWAAETGQSAPTSFDAARNIVGDEIVKAVTGSAGALGDREAAAATISKINSPQSLKDVIKTYKTLMVGQLTGLKQQFVSAGGKPESFDAKLSPETKKFLATEKRTPATPPPATNAKGWKLHQDAKGNYGYVSPDGNQVEAVPSGR